MSTAVADNEGWVVESSEPTPQPSTPETPANEAETAQTAPEPAPVVDEEEPAARDRDENGRFAAKQAETGEETAGAETTEPPKPSKRSPEGRKLTLQQEIDNLTRQRRELERQIEAARGTTPEPAPQAPQQPSGERFPAFDDWSQANPQASYEDYVDARADWRAERKFTSFLSEAQQRAQQTEQLHRAKHLQTQGRTVYGDWDDVFSRVGDVTISPALEKAILTDPDGHRLAYELAKDPAAHGDVLDAPDDFALGVALGTLKARLSGAPAAPPRQTTATSLPAPIKPLGSSPTQPVVSLDDLPFEKWTPEHLQKAAELDRKRRGRL